jgi:hypothetical protein
MAEARAISERRGVDMGVAREMALTNEMQRLKGEVPEYHRGGPVGGEWTSGLKEVLAWLEKGETVLTQRMTQNLIGMMQLLTAPSPVAGQALAMGPINITVYAQDGTDAGRKIARELRRLGV